MKQDRSTSFPKYRRQKRQGRHDLGFVELHGVRHYLGPYDSPEGHERYHRLLAEFASNGGHLPVSPDDITVVELVNQFRKHVESVYRDHDGRPTKHAQKIRLAIATVRQSYGRTNADDFGPLALKSVRQEFVGAGMTRKSVNERVGYVKQMFAWGVENEMLNPSVHHALSAVKGLRQGRTDAPEPKLKRPVPQPDVNAIEAYVSRQVWALVQLQLLTGARGGELVVMRPIDIEMTGRIWLYRLSDHKTAHRGRERIIYLGPRAQSVARAFLPWRPVDAYLFSPREAEQERFAKATTHRHQPVVPPKTDRKIDNHYTSASYRRAIERACGKAGVPAWTPHRLRHSAATFIRKEFGVEAAQIMLGHARADVTQIYAEVNQAKALEIAAKIG